MWGATLVNSARDKRKDLPVPKRKNLLAKSVSDASRQAGHTMLRVLHLILNRSISFVQSSGSHANIQELTKTSVHSVEGICEGPMDLSLDSYCLNSLI